MSNLSHALPLVPPPADCQMTVAECDAQIRHLRDVHCASVQVFWDGLKARLDGCCPEDSHRLKPIQQDLLNLFASTKSSHVVERIAAPEVHIFREIWERITQPLSGVIRDQIAMTDYEIFELVGVVSLDVGTVSVHRFQSSQVFCESNLCLDVPVSIGSNWFYRALHYKPDGFDDDAYAVASLYVVGELQSSSGQWVPLSLTDDQRHAVIAAVDVMECLVDEDNLSSLMLHADVLPSFPSGVESTLGELQLMRGWLTEQAAVSDRNEQHDPRSNFSSVTPIKDFRSESRSVSRADIGVQLDLVGFEQFQAAVDLKPIGRHRIRRVVS